MTAPLNVGSVAWDTIEAHVVQGGLRNQIELLTDLLVEHDTGVLVTLDEIHQNQLEELREVAPRCSTRSGKAASLHSLAPDWLPA